MQILNKSLGHSDRVWSISFVFASVECGAECVWSIGAMTTLARRHAPHEGRVPLVHAQVQQDAQNALQTDATWDKFVKNIFWVPYCVVCNHTQYTIIWIDENQCAKIYFSF